MLVSGVQDVGNDPNHVRILHEMLEELDDEELKQKAEEIGIVRVFQEERARVLQKLRESDPEHWERFAESQIMATKNRMGPAAEGGENGEAVKAEGKREEQENRGDDEAVVVD